MTTMNLLRGRCKKKTQRLTVKQWIKNDDDDDNDDGLVDDNDDVGKGGQYVQACQYNDDNDDGIMSLLIIMMTKVDMSMTTRMNLLWQVDSTCKMDLHKFPMDTQTCKFQVSLEQSKEFKM